MQSPSRRWKRWLAFLFREEASFDRLTSISSQPVQRRLYWVDHAVRRLKGELIKVLLLPSPPRTWCRRAEDHLKTWELLSRPRVFGYTRRRKDWIKASCELAQDQWTRGAYMCDDVNSISDASSTRPGWMPQQVQETSMKTFGRVWSGGLQETIRANLTVFLSIFINLQCFSLRA